MTLFEYLNIKDYNLLTDKIYAYGDNIAILKKNIKITNVSSKINTTTISLSEQLQLPVTLIDTNIPLGEEIDHLIIKDNKGNKIYREWITEIPNCHIIKSIDNKPYQIQIRGLYLHWSFHNRPLPNQQKTLLHINQFNTIYPDGSKFDIRNNPKIIKKLFI